MLIKKRFPEGYLEIIWLARNRPDLLLETIKKYEKR